MCQPRTRLLPAAPPILALSCLASGLLPVPVAALGQASFVDATASPGALRLVVDGLAAPIVVDSRDHASVLRAAGDLQQDVQRVTRVRPSLARDSRPVGADVVIAGTLGHSREIDELVRSGKLDVRELQDRWEASIIQTVAQPWPGVGRALVVVGSDARGTIYGIYDVSEQIGVSPWYFWADVPVRQREQLFVRAGRRVRSEPAVRYRGIFLNDEEPALGGWTREKNGGFNSRLYARVFELLLRLRANFLWPAMWGNAFFEDDPLNAQLAREYGIVMGTSHHEPMTRAHDEWRRHGEGPWSYATNADRLRTFWTEGIRRTAGYENVITLGMRGDGDEPMSREANVALLESIVADQRRILAEHRSADLTAVPQVWALYKEVQEYYEKGMRVPDDVTLLWCDDNWGNIRRLPTPEERGRTGGAGIYYHFDYVGGPRSYKWLNTVPLPKIWEQMHLAYRYGATRLWVVNVGDLKPMEVPIQFFLDYAWDPERWPAESLPGYLRAWAEREFGREHASEVAEIVSRYTRFNSRRKPEMLAPGTYSLVDYREAETVVSDYRELARRAEAVHASLPAEARDAFFQLVLHPVRACAVLNDLYVTVGRNRLHAVQGRASANDLARTARDLFREDEALTRAYHELRGGKWNHMMDQTHIGYTYWNQPLRNAMPGVQEVQLPLAGEMGVAIEGSEASWPDWGPRQPVLPALDAYDRRPRYLEVFNRGQQPFDFSIETAEPWLRVDAGQGSVERERRVLVSADWDGVPAGTTTGSLAIAGPNGVRVVVKVPVSNPPSPRPAELRGFVETDGCISIEAEHHSRAVAPPGRKWQTIPGFGLTLSGVTAFPVTAEASLPSATGMRLEYELHLFHDGPVSVHAYLAPTQQFRPGPGLRYAVSFDDETPQIVDVHADGSLAAWEKAVADGVMVRSSNHVLARPGPHVLKFWTVDPGLVLQKLVVDAGGVRPSYLGPPESPRRPGLESAASAR